MKKKYIIPIIIIILILVAVTSVILYKNIHKDTEIIQEVKEYNYFVLKQNDLYGVLDKKGNIIIEPTYKEVKIPNPEKGVFVCYEGENTKILNEKNQEILKQYSDVEPIRLKNIISDLMYEKSILKYKENDKYGLLNLEGKEITNPTYDEIDSLPYKEGQLLVKQNEKYGVIDITGNKIIETNYDKITVDGYYSDENQYQYAGYIVSTKTEEGFRYGYLNSNGKKILDTEYNDISRITEIQDNNNSYLICAKNGQYGITKNEQQIIENEYQSIRYDGTNHLFVVEKSRKYGIINLNGKLIIPIEYNQIDITGTYLYVQNEQGTTVYNNDGTPSDISSNISILNTNNEQYKIKIDTNHETKYGVINQKGEQLIENKYHYIEYLYDNYFIVSNENGKIGIVDDKDAIKLDISYDSLQKIQNTDLIQTTLTESELTQIYTKTMEKICEMTNASIEVSDDYIKISNETEIKYFSKEGKELKNTEIYPNNKLFVKIENNKYGFVDKDGNLVIDYKYDKAYEFNEFGFAAVKKDGKWGCVNEEAQEVIPPTYEIKNIQEPYFIGSYYRVLYGFGEFYYTDAK